MNLLMRQLIVSFFVLVVSIPALGGIGDFFKGKNQDQPQESIPSPVEELANNDVRKSRNIGKAVGALLGAGAAALATKNVDDGQKRSAIIVGSALAGGALGDQVGKKLGETAAKRRRQYASEQEFLESEIAASENAIEVRQQDIDEVNSRVAQNEKRVEEFKAKAHLTRKEKEEAENLKQEIERTIAQNEQIMKDYDEKIAYLQHSLETSKAEATASAEEKEKWEQRYADLKGKTSNLIAQRSAMQEQTQQLAQSREDLNDVLS